MPEDNVIRIRLSLKGRPIKSFSFNKDVITVGRDPDADIYLDNPSISREHVRFERMPNGHFSVRDPGSSNGAFLNEERIQAAMVYNNDVVRIGKFSLWISLERDRRGDAPRTERKVASDPSQGTMMLTPEEINRLMSTSREKDLVPPQSAGATPSNATATAIAKATTNYAGDTSRSRIVRLVGIGAVLILATSLGAGVAWLFLR